MLDGAGELAFDGSGAAPEYRATGGRKGTPFTLSGRAARYVTAAVLPRGLPHHGRGRAGRGHRRGEARGAGRAAGEEVREAREEAAASSELDPSSSSRLGDEYQERRRRPRRAGGPGYLGAGADDDARGERSTVKDRR